MLDFCGKNNIILPYETISADNINAAYERCVRVTYHSLVPLTLLLHAADE